MPTSSSYRTFYRWAEEIAREEEQTLRLADRVDKRRKLGDIDRPPVDFLFCNAVYVVEMQQPEKHHCGSVE